MKKAFKIIFALLLTVILTASVLGINISAASATTHFSPGKSEYAVGEQVTVTIKFDAGTPVYSIDGSISYDNTVVQYVSGGANHGSSVKFAESLSGETQITVSAVFRTIAEGKCNFSFSGFCTDGNLQPHSANTGYFINVKNPAPPTSSQTPTEPSKNANLASLKVSGATLSPKFNSNTTSYTATVPYNTDRVTISAGAADAGATFTGAGTISLNVGDNRRTITVTAASGAKKSYNLVIKRLPEGQAEPETPPETADPLLISAEDTTRKIMQDISSMPVPESFSATTTVVNDVEVGALTEPGEKYTLLYTTLEDGSDGALYYKNEEGEYKRLRYIEVNGKFYIIEDMPLGTAPKGWYKDTMSISSGTVEAYRSNNAALKDFYVLYCYADGEYGFYRFDSLKTTIQRAPDFKLASLVSNPSADSQKESIFKRFANMNTVGKVIIILIGLAIICIVVLVVLLVLHLVRTKKEDEEGLFSDNGEQDFNEEINPSDFNFTVENTDIPKDTEMPEQSDDDF